MLLFDYMKLKRRELLTQIAAELKAQCHDQHLVNEVCYSLPGNHVVVGLADGRFRSKTRLRIFMIVTFLLAETLCIAGISITTKAAFFKLLSQRRARIQVLMDSGADDGGVNEGDVADLDRIRGVGMQLLITQSVFHLVSPGGGPPPLPRKTL